MGSISKTTDTESDLTVLKAIGHTTAADIIASVKETYGTALTSQALGDFTEADGSGITGDQLKGVALQIGTLIGMRSGPRTALVYGRTFGFGMGRMFETFIESEHIPLTIRVFNDLGEARTWLLKKARLEVCDYQYQ